MHSKKSLVTVSIKGTTIAHDIEHKYNASKILLRPASEGTGLIAGGAKDLFLSFLELKILLQNLLGSNNPNNLVQATVEALLQE